MPTTSRSLSGKVVAITGAARGIGKATAEALARQGAHVAIGDLDVELAQQVADAIGNGAIALELDVTDRPAFTAFLDEAERRLGPLDVLINNAGIMPTNAIDETDDATTTKEIAINLHAVIHGTREAIKRMKPRGRGHIVNVSSPAGRIAGPRVATYSATKAGVAVFSEAAALELYGTGVDVSVIFPALTKTELTVGLKEMRGVPQIKPQDVAEAIVGTLQKPRFEVPVPRAMGLLLKFNQALPPRARFALARVTKADSVIADVDETARAAYEGRVRRTVAADEADTTHPVPVNGD
jgi:NAD(P)-dependent dehydrogenase (short-subunit alcohol dehydrogenase family)